MDLSVDLLQATVKIEQPLKDGRRTVGAGFLINDPTPDGRPRIVLITAEHVLAAMPQAQASVGYRIETADHSWSFSPQSLAIRDTQGKPLWTRHPGRDVAAITVQVPADLARKAIPVAYLASDDTFSRNRVAPGDEMIALGFPRGLSANSAGFAILRSGRVASYPLGPSDATPTFLMDFSVYPGNSGGPVFVAEKGAPAQFIAGILTQEVELDREKLGLGIVTHARYVRETLDMLDGRTPPAPLASALRPLGGQAAVAAESATAP